MQARLEIKRFPPHVATVIVGLVIALVIGLVLGYLLKPTPTSATSPNQHPPVSAQPASVDACEFIDKHKAC
jgi:hypothetical protein